MKKFLSILLCLIMVMSLLPMSAFADLSPNPGSGDSGTGNPDAHTHEFRKENVSFAASANGECIRLTASVSCSAEGCTEPPEKLVETFDLNLSDYPYNISLNLPCQPWTVDLMIFDRKFKNDVFNNAWSDLSSKTFPIQGTEEPHTYVNPEFKDGKWIKTCACGATQDINPAAPEIIQPNIKLSFYEGETPVKEDVTVSLLAENASTPKYTADGNYSYTITVPAGDINKLAPEGYLPLTEGLEVTLISIFNKQTEKFGPWSDTEQGAVRKISLTKAGSADFAIRFHDGNNAEGTRPDSASINLFDGEGYGKTLTLSAPDYSADHTYDKSKFTGQIDGKNSSAGEYSYMGTSESEGSYRIHYVLPDDTVINAKLLDAKPTPTSRTITVTINAENLAGDPISRSKTFNLFGSQTSYNGISVNAVDGFEGSKELIPRYKADNSPMSYTVSAQLGTGGTQLTAFALDFDSLNNAKPLILSDFDAANKAINIKVIDKQPMDIDIRPADENVPLPAEIPVMLQANGEDCLDKPLVLSLQDEDTNPVYKATVNLPQFNANEEPLKYSIRVVEDQISGNTGYEFTPSDRNPMQMKFNTYVPHKANIGVYLHWLNENGDTSYRKPVTVELWVGDSRKASINLTAENSYRNTWYGDFGLFPLKNADKSDINYVIKYNGLEHYHPAMGDPAYVDFSSAADPAAGTDIRIYKLDYTLDSRYDIEVFKTWENTVGYPKDVEVQLKDAAGNVISTQTLRDAVGLSGGAQQTAVFSNVWTSDAKGNQIIYQIGESVPDGYYQKSNSGVVDNTTAAGVRKVCSIVNAPMPTFNLHVEKVFKNTVQPPKSVTVQLMSKTSNGDWVNIGGKVKIEQQKASDGTLEWKHIFKDLPELSKSGQKLEYKVVEDEIKNYKVSYDTMQRIDPTSTDMKITITNTRIDKGVKTGDESNLGLWIGIAAAALVVIAVVAVVVIKKNKKQDDVSDEDQKI